MVTLTAARPKFNWPREDGDRNQKTGKLTSWRISLNEKCKSGNLVLGWGGGGGVVFSRGRSAVAVVSSAGQI